MGYGKSECTTMCTEGFTTVPISRYEKSIASGHISIIVTRSRKRGPFPQQFIRGYGC